MTTYVLFIYGAFEDHDDVEYFCMEVLGASDILSSLKYVISDTKNIVIIFDSDRDDKNVQNEMESLLENDNIMFYFMFKKEDIVMSYIPETMRNLIYKPSSDIIKIQVTPADIPSNSNLVLDEILEKIKKHGVDSLTPTEKKFLDNFEN